MKRFITIFLLILCLTPLAAQQACDCNAEFEFVNQQLRNTASFKSQIEGKKEAAFEAQYELLKQKYGSTTSKLTCFWGLNQLMKLVRDKHAYVTEVNPGFSLKDLRDADFITAYRETPAFTQFPKSALNLDERYSSLKQKLVEDVEGIYTIGNLIEIGVYRTAQADSLVGVILKSELGNWEPGHVFMYMKETEVPGEYDIAHYGQVTKQLLFSSGQPYQFGMLFSNVRKWNAGTNYSRIDRANTEAYTLQRIDEQVQYVWMDDFSRYQKEKQRDALVKQIKNELDAEYLIVDLRNNGGGASKISLPIVRALKKKEVKLYVITNYYSISNAEQTTVRLKNLEGTVHLGQRTYGAIAYGNNYGNSYTSPSGLFSFGTTDMTFNHFLKYEEVGITPDIQLNNTSDWVEQTLKHIKAQNQ